MTMTDLLALNCVSAYNAESNFNWQASILPIEVINHFINLEIRSGNPDDGVSTALKNIVINFDSYDKYSVQDTLTSINTHIASPLESGLTDNSVNYAIVRNLNDKLRRVKTHSDHFIFEMVNVIPRIVTLALWKSKLSEVGNELLRDHASYIAGLPPNRHENEKDPNPKDQSGAGDRSINRQGDFDNAEPNCKKSETVKGNRCDHNADTF